MQPIQIGMNSVVVLLMLLLAVPLQLFLSHCINKSYSDTADPYSESETGKAVRGDINSVRMEAFNSLKLGIASAVDYLHSTFLHYSKWKNLKELFVVPYKRGHFKTAKYKSQSKIYLERTEKLDKFGPTGSLKSSTTAEVKPSPLPDSEQDSETKKSKPPLKRVLKEPTSKAKEVEKYLQAEVYFTRSKEPRVKRGPQVKLRVGQVVKHRKDEYYGVIIGWDEVAKAPEDWLKRYYSKRQDVLQSPHYLVMVDARQQSASSPFHYLPQEDLELVEDNTQIQAPELSKYFEGYSNHRHLPRPWLLKTYPSDV